MQSLHPLDCTLATSYLCVRYTSDRRAGKYQQLFLLTKLGKGFQGTFAFALYVETILLTNTIYCAKLYL